MSTVTRRDMLCNQIHLDLADAIIEAGHTKKLFIVPLIVEDKGTAVAVANYLRNQKFDVVLSELNKNFLYELLVKWS